MLRFKKLEELSSMDPEEIVIELVLKRNGFRDLLDSKNLTDDTLVLIIRVLVKVCSVPLKSHKMAIINLALNDNFHKMLQNCILQMMFATVTDKKRSTYFWDDAQGFFENARAVFQSIFETSPTRACEVVTRTIEVFNHTLEKLSEVSGDTKDKFQKLQDKMKMYADEIEIKKAAKTQSSDEHYEEPPDNFRELTVYPTYNEIMSDAFVRKNLIDRPYNSVDHYLDVQFRLLKEDFVGPLRDGISEYQTCKKPFGRCKKFSNIRIHKDVTFVSPYCSKDQAGVLLQFEVIDRKKRKPGKKYSYSKRFMYGSLVCFTRNNFEHLLFGKIIERDQELMEKGYVVVGFEPGYDDYALNEPYLMVECTVYFEPYYHVLKALQSTYEDDFAMKKYIIDVDPNIVRPQYLDDTSSYLIGDLDVVLFDEGWPTATQLSLNDSQHSAFKAGLTQEYVVIQGPPGTGKTFLGLKLANTFITNKSHWHNDSPMLVVCYTNHALDQFLEGIIPTTNEVIRIGGQSKSKDLEKFNLKEKRKEVAGRLRSKGYGKALYQFRNELADYMRQIKNCGEQLEQIRTGEGVLVNFSEFAKVDPEYSISWFIRAKDEEITSWLLERKRLPRGELRKVNVNTVDDESGEAEREFDELQNNEIIANTCNDQYDLLSSVTGNKVKYLLRVDDMQAVANRLRAEIEFLGDEHHNMVYSKRLELIEQIIKLEDDIEYVQNRFEEYKNITVKNKPQGCNLYNPWEMSANDRWMLYFYWLHIYENYLVRQLAELEGGRREIYKQFTELQHLQDVEVMRQMLVVGMTTTSAARLQTVLQSLRSPIVIVEEAAEVLEAHIIASLTNHCQHLILIGDHQQLKPSTASYVMEVRFNLGISLFERMVRNNIQCHTLGVQHRMRPEIAKLIVPAVYSKLDNHPSVENFPNVQGVDCNLYFIDHHHEEEEVHDSKVNRHEVSYIISLARHLILNGYKPEDITILAAYSAQMFALWEERKRSTHLLKDVRVAVLDNYQGEESKIILLSLVRNNSEGKIGFLKIENRVCVALSRAREGLYIMGNMSMLCQASQIWPKIKTVLVDQNSLGRSLRLRCQIHTRNVTEITVPEDFENVSEGGCNIMCDSIMNCGHVCPKVCHIIDRQHENISCKANCTKILCDNEHVCPKMCFEECGPCMVLMKRTLKCFHVINITCSTDLDTVKCMQLVTAKLPCGHTDPNKLCHTSADVHVCPFPCAVRVEPCGHACRLSCHIRDDPDHLNYACRKKCEKPAKGCSTGDHKCKRDCYEDCSLCEVIVEKRRTTCTHRLQIPCNEDPNQVVCKMACRRMLPCGHACKKKCSETCGDCKVMVAKELSVCKHQVKVRCSEPPRRDRCSEQCPLTLSCGHVCQAKCNEPCTQLCTHLIEHDKVADCGHKFKIACHLRTKVLPGNSYKLLRFCDGPCTAVLECGHKCSGTCGSCAQGRIHATCNQKCGRILVCGHECPFPCREACQPCNRSCTYKCAHSICGKQCGEPCTKCAESCERHCVHSACVKICGDICSVAPCTNPCKKKLKCGHDCVGFCGDPCPPLCRVCHYDDLTETFFGTEDEEGARFVLLNECGHIVESTGMDQWMTVDDGNAIKYKCCPKCKTPLTSTQRYSSFVKQTLLDVYAVKLKFFGNAVENEEKRAELLSKMDGLERLTNEMPASALLLQKIVKNLKNSVRAVHKGRKITLNTSLSRIYLSKMQVLENIIKAFIAVKLASATVINVAIEDMEFLLNSLSREENTMTNQEISDLQKETNRFSCKVQLLKISESDDVFKAKIYQNAYNKKLYETIYYKLSSISPFQDSADEEIRKNIAYLSKEVGTYISQVERQQVIQAMQMAKGHWFKCPNGHYYAIGECGGAMQIGKCIECGVAIGGQSHALLSTNRHAGEIDGSTTDAWSDTANNFNAFLNRQF